MHDWPGSSPLVGARAPTGVGCITKGFPNTINQKCYWGYAGKDGPACPADAKDVSALYGCWGGYFKVLMAGRLLPLGAIGSCTEA